MTERRSTRAPPPAGKERRRRARRGAPRIAVHFPVESSIGGPRTSYVATNISKGGLSLRGEWPLGEGSETLLEFLLPCTGSLVRCRGEVRHLEENGSAWMNVEFTGLGVRDRRAIQAYVDDILEPARARHDVF